MKIETKFNIGDFVRMKDHTGTVTDVNVWVTSEDETPEIEYRINDPHNQAWGTVGIWAVESEVEVA